jgi:hypothetical protein
VERFGCRYCEAIRRRGPGSDREKIAVPGPRETGTVAVSRVTAAMLTSALFLVPSFLTLLLLGVYVRNFRRATVSQRSAAFSFLKLEDHAQRGKKKFIGFFHPYW